jgi:hypothetical protein
MPFIAALIGALQFSVGSLVGRVLLSLALGFVTYKGFDTSVTFLLDKIKEDMAAMPAGVVSFLAWLWVDKAIAAIFSAYTTALTIKLAGSTQLTKLVSKG